jgi:thiamine transport system substrate-binding protein
VLSYATSPAGEVYFSEGKLTEPPTGNILPPKGSFKQIEFAGILKGTKNRELAQRWIDYMTGLRFQTDIPLKMFVYPANSQAPLPDLFKKFAPIPADPAIFPPDQIAKQRDQWIQEWTRIVQK